MSRYVYVLTTVASADYKGGGRARGSIRVHCRERGTGIALCSLR